MNGAMIAEPYGSIVGLIHTKEDVDGFWGEIRELVVYGCVREGVCKHLHIHACMIANEQSSW